MRVIAGVHRGRRLFGPKGQVIRPTSDRVKEALFSILGEHITGARVLDLYAGTGSVGIEALSRGAAHVTFVESDRDALRLVHSNLQQFGLEDSATICASQVRQFFRGWTERSGLYDIVFCDPPYHVTADLIELAKQWDARWMARDVIVILEHGRKEKLPSTLGLLSQVKRYDYGDTALTRFQITLKETPVV
ncbi:MAG: putative Ribosomal small subunit methyltransferase [Nitrospira sp.]|jgi:16S rRNA (guanine(966)-N(2))-methyltransferase RsmD|nr:putative Ribosomal small subunit methyltransferase [Nitrospira sp.]